MDNKFKIELIKHHDNIHHIEIHGKLDVFSFKESREFLSSLNDTHKEFKVAIDLSSVTFIASSGWSLLVATSRNVFKNDGKMAICNMSPELLRVYQSMKLEKLLPYFNTFEEACDYLTVS